MYYFVDNFAKINFKSHLRGKTKLKTEKPKKDEYYDWVEREYQMKKELEKEDKRSE